jgi:hypothetical protein
MTIFRFSVVLLVAIAVVALGYVGQGRYAESSGREAAAAVAKACHVPPQHVTFAVAGERKGRIAVASQYAFCPPPERDGSIKCVHDWAKRHGYESINELATASCSRFGGEE